MKSLVRGAMVLLVAAGFGAQPASAQVVDDSACPKYAVDIAAFATCEGDTVAGSDIARVSAQRAAELKRLHGRTVLLIDVCGADSVAGVRAPSAIDAVLPLDARARSDGIGDTATQAEREFVPAVRDRIAALGGDADTPVLLICRGSQQALVAARLLRRSGFADVGVVDDAPGGDAIRAARSPGRAGEREEPRD